MYIEQLNIFVFVSKFEYYLVDIVIRSKNYLQKCRGASFSSKTTGKTVEGLFFFYVSINMCFCTFGDEIDISSSLLSSSIKTQIINYSYPRYIFVFVEPADLLCMKCPQEDMLGTQARFTFIKSAPTYARDKV